MLTADVLAEFAEASRGVALADRAGFELHLAGRSLPSGERPPDAITPAWIAAEVARLSALETARRALAVREAKPKRPRRRTDKMRAAERIAAARKYAYVRQERMAARVAAGLPALGIFARPKQERCARGHELAEGNLYHRNDGHRQCKACAVEKARERRAAKRLSRALDSTPKNG